MFRPQSDFLPVEYRYKYIDGVEDLSRYRPGGYHPVTVGDVFVNRYHVVDKLGYGGYSTVWLARDTHQECYVAVKVGTAGSLLHEVKTLRALSRPKLSNETTRRGGSLIPHVLDEFELRGPNGSHPCYTMPAARCDLQEISYSCLFPLEVARAISGKLILATAYVHSQGYVHGGSS